MAQRRRKPGRNVNGILLLDKPCGITSNAALQNVKRLFKANKAGHTGSLDPLATGMLPICLGEATKMSGFLLEADKRYQVVVKLGVKTTTGDAEGEVINTQEINEIEASLLSKVLDSFTGEIEQIPPMHSALKLNGQPLYKLAHKGIVVERQPRSVTIRELTLVNYSRDELEIDVSCSKGTYIRTLAEDIGDKLGCGAHVSKLRRLSVGPSSGYKMITLDELEIEARDNFSGLDEMLLPMESALSQWPEVSLSQDIAFFLKKGQAVTVPHSPSRGLVKLYSGENGFLVVGHILDDGRVAPTRFING